jgi:hypothetical protein
MKQDVEHARIIHHLTAALSAAQGPKQDLLEYLIDMALTEARAASASAPTPCLFATGRHASACFERTLSLCKGRFQLPGDAARRGLLSISATWKTVVALNP